MESAEIESIIQKVIGRHIPLADSYVFLFGSRASGMARPYSDYDVGIFRGEKFSLATIAKIKDDLENYPIPVDVDVVDFALVTEDFRILALKDIHLWNRPKKNLKLI